jgi:hypothetical protein
VVGISSIDREREGYSDMISLMESPNSRTERGERGEYQSTKKFNIGNESHES